MRRATLVALALVSLAAPAAAHARPWLCLGHSFSWTPTPLAVPRDHLAMAVAKASDGRVIPDLWGHDTYFLKWVSTSLS